MAFPQLLLLLIVLLQTLKLITLMLLLLYQSNSDGVSATTAVLDVDAVIQLMFLLLLAPLLSLADSEVSARTLS